MCACGRICDFEQVPGSPWGTICDMEQVPGSFRDRICDVEQVPGAVAGARDVAVAGHVTLQRPAAVAVASQVSVAGTAALNKGARAPGPKHYYRLAWTCQLN